MRTKNRVKELRVSEGHTSQREFADFITKKLGYPVSYSTINKLENQIGNPPWELLDVLATHFNVTTDYLMGRTDENLAVACMPKNNFPPEAKKALDIFYQKMREAYKK